MSSLARSGSFGKGSSSAGSVAGDLKDGPLPNAGPCPLCKRGRTHENPCPRRHPGPYLAFHKPTTGAKCLPCVNFTRGCWTGKDEEKLRQDLREDEHYESYMVGLHDHEAVSDSTPPGGRLRNVAESGKVRVPECLSFVEEDGIEADQVVGVFWPLEVLKREEPDKQPPPKWLGMSIAAPSIAVCGATAALVRQMAASL